MAPLTQLPPIGSVVPHDDEAAAPAPSAIPFTSLPPLGASVPHDDGGLAMTGAPEAEDAPPPSAASRYWNELRATTVGGLPSALNMAAVGGNPLSMVKPENLSAARDMARAHWEILKKAFEDYKQGNYPAAAGRTVLGLAPGVGPLIHTEAEAANEGDYAKAAGGLTGLGLTLGAGKMIEKTGVPTGVPGLARDPVNRYAENIGVKQTVGQAVQSPMLRATEHGAAYTPIGAVIEYLRSRTNRRAMTGEAGRIQQNVRAGAPVDTQEAGATLLAAQEARKASLGAAGHRLYGLVERAANDPRQSRVVTKAAGLQPEPMAMPIDMRGVRAMLGPVWDHIETFTAESQGRLANARKALGSLINGDDFMPQQVAEEHLSSLKEIVRSTKGNNRRLASQAVKELQRAIDTQLRTADPMAAQALKVARLTWRLKSKTGELIDKTFGANPDYRNPGQKLSAMLANEDRAVPVLQRAVAQVPQAIPAIARSLVDDLLAQKGQKMLADWKNIGPRTKAILFKPAQIEMLDAYAELAARLAYNPNPSGTATTLIASLSTGAAAEKGLLGSVGTAAIGPVALHGAWVSYLLQSPTAVRLATRAYTLALRQATRGQLDAVTTAQVAGLVGQALRAAEQAPSNQDDEADGDQ